ncbi:MAG: glycine dehydrogenase, partial [Thermovirgaceae bacterium]
MSSYLPNTEADRKKMLEALGVSSVEDLFEDIPKEVRQKTGGGLPGPLCEDELARHMTALSEQNCHLGQSVSFLGAGIYDHFIPSVVDAVASRGEFYTAYTPYQPEISQGTLTA